MKAVDMDQALEKGGNAIFRLEGAVYSIGERFIYLFFGMGDVFPP